MLSASACCVAMTFGLAQSAAAVTKADVRSLKALLNSMGTSVINRRCSEENLFGYYELSGDTIDQIIICTNNHRKGDLDQYWETLAHESTHVMQGCLDGNVIDDSRIGRVYRELKEINLTSYKDLKSYESKDRREEVEARWMELQLPKVVINMLRKACKGYIR